MSADPVSRPLRSRAAGAIEFDAGWHARLAARRITAELDAGLAAAGLGSLQFSLLCLVASAPDDTLGALAERAGLDASTMSRNVDVLAKAGWVEVALVEADRRRRAVWLTEAGARKLVAALPLWQRAHGALQARLGQSTTRGLQRAARLAPTPTPTPENRR